MQRIYALPANFVELPSEIILREIFSGLDPKFISSILPQINKQLGATHLDAFYWKAKIKKHFPAYEPKAEDKDPFNKYTFKKLETVQYPHFSEPEKELVRLIKEIDVESLEEMPITLEMLDQKEKDKSSVLSIAHNVGDDRLLACLNKKGFEAAKISPKTNGMPGPEKKDMHGRTILYWAFMFEQDVETLIQLMKQGSFAELYFGEFQPFHFAIKLGRFDFIKALFTDETFKDSLGSLLEQRETGFSLIQLAARDGNLEMMKIMIKHVASDKRKKMEILNQPHGKGFTLLMIAVENCHIDIIKYLLEEGANPNIASATDASPSKTMTPLTLAWAKKNIETTRLLLSKMKNKFLNNIVDLKNVLSIVGQNEVRAVLVREESIKFDRQLERINSQNGLPVTKAIEVIEMFVQESTLQKIIRLLQEGRNLSLRFSDENSELIEQSFSLIAPYADQVTGLEFVNCLLTDSLIEDICLLFPKS